MGMKLDRELKEWGPHKYRDADVLIYSLGSLNEGHGPALSPQNDDMVAVETALRVFKQTGFPYMFHLQYSSDRAGEIARDWCPAWTEPEDTTRGVIRDMKESIAQRQKPVSHAVIISGHGGNNFLKDEEDRLSREIGVPVMYVCPFVGCKTAHDNYGEIEVEHANSGEHSVAAYMGVLNKEALDEINRVAENDPEGALRRWKPLCGLGGYVLSDDPRYEALRNPEWGLVDHAKRFLEEKHILGDHEVGKALFEQNLNNTIEQIVAFIKD